METVLLLIGCIIAYLIAYRTYGRFLSRRIFSLSSDRLMPSVQFNDQVDFVPTHKEILFGHHYTSIAGTGPIVGPAIAIIWGWVPAILWVMIGAIFMGAVHDFGALVVSARHQGRSISDLTGDLINPRVRVLFFVIIFFTLLIVIAIFAWIIAYLFDKFPYSVFPIWMELPIAVVLGWAIYKRGLPQTTVAIIALVLLYVTVIIGVYFPLQMPSLFGLEPIMIWVFILFIYAYIASVLPVQLLLQPRDYINGHQLFVALGLLILGVVFARPQMVAPALNSHPVGAPDIIPFLFITIACGAISGFHSLVASGTSSKQLKNETDAQMIGYGSMLMEGVLAVLVIIAVAAGIGMSLNVGDTTLTGLDAWRHHYASWKAAAGLGSKVNAFVYGSANLIAAIGIPYDIAIVIMGVFIASFAGTTLDTATRIQRYIIVELASDLKVKPLTNRHLATFVAVGTALLLALSQKGGKGALILWPLFGTVNQLLAGLSLLAVTIYLYKRGKGVLYTLIPMMIILFLTSWAMALNLKTYMSQQSWHLVIIGFIIVVLELWMVAESLIIFFHRREMILED